MNLLEVRVKQGAKAEKDYEVPVILDRFASGPGFFVCKGLFCFTNLKSFGRQ
jgi:hypothetical protein